MMLNYGILEGWTRGASHSKAGSQLELIMYVGDFGWLQRLMNAILTLCRVVYRSTTSNIQMTGTSSSSYPGLPKQNSSVAMVKKSTWPFSHPGYPLSTLT